MPVAKDRLLALQAQVVAVTQQRRAEQRILKAQLQNAEGAVHVGDGAEEGVAEAGGAVSGTKTAGRTGGGGAGTAKATSSKAGTGTTAKRARPSTSSSASSGQAQGAGNAPGSASKKAAPNAPPPAQQPSLQHAPPQQLHTTNIPTVTSNAYPPNFNGSNPWSQQSSES